MSEQPLRLNFGESDTEQLRALVQRMGEFVALFEVAEDKLREREAALERHITNHEISINNSMEQISHRISELESVMTETGVARWRIAAESSLKEGKVHLSNIKHCVEEFRQLSKEVCTRLDRATSYTVKGVSEAVNSFRISDFRQLTEGSCAQVERTAVTAVKNIAQVTRWFYWKKLTLVFTFALGVSVITGLYLNAEWPWEIHRDVVRERIAGVAVMRTWAQLQPRDRRIIQENSKQGLV